MADYDYFIDFNAIECADTAFRRNEFNVSSLLYELALARIMKYPGDRMRPMNIKAALDEKLKDSRAGMQRNPQLKELEKRTWHLTKTAFVQGKQCKKLLYLQKHKKEEKTEASQETKQLWNKGREFEGQVRKKLFPNGIDVSEAMASKWNYFSSYTDNAVEHNWSETLFEASIIEDGILVMIDMLHQHSTGEVDLYEIKLHSELTEVVLWDLSIQYYVAKRKFGNKLKRFHVVLNRGNGNFEVIDVKEKLEEKLEESGAQIREFSSILQASSAPDIAMGSHCDLPYSCAFKEYCSKKESLADLSTI